MPILDEVRITELPGADPLAGPELIPLVQSGVTKSRSAQNLVLDGGLQAHLDAADPHTQYLKESEYEAHRRSREDLLKQATLSLDFANNKYEVYEGPVNSLTQMPFNEVLDFTRASAATARTATGKIQEVLTDEQRLVGNREGLLIEEARTNLFKFSEMGDAYVLNGSAVKGGTDVANGVSLKELIPNAGSASEGTGTPGFDFATGHSQAGDHFFSCVLKQSGITKVIVRRNTTAVYPVELCRVDLVAGTFVSSVPGCTLEPFGDGAYLLSAPYSAIATSVAGYYVGAYDPASTDGVNSFYVGAVQLEQGSFPTSYIPTTGTQVTRAVDDCVRALGDEFNPSEGTLFVRCTVPRNNDDRNAHICEFSDGSDDNRIILTADANTDYIDAFLYGVDGAAASLTVNVAGIQGQVANFALSYSMAGLSLAINGAVTTAVANSNAYPVGLSQLTVGDKWDNSNPVVSSLYEDFRAIPTALSEAELITLTGGT